ncbi:MAG: hypothetical protein A2X49_02255 [Lentisphaerae bacterium GWF2_52_8]|nr:MAG: hypothetical protein A2X49_02255 [Lentisphaerae bacterium GWF2_52_8]
MQALCQDLKGKVSSTHAQLQSLSDKLPQSKQSGRIKVQGGRPASLLWLWSRSLRRSETLPAIQIAFRYKRMVCNCITKLYKF